AFTAHGATSLVHLHSTDYEASVAIATAFTEACLCASSSFARIPSSGDSWRVRWVLGARLTLCTSASQRLGAFAIRPHPRVPGFPGFRLLCPIRLSVRALAFRWGLPWLLPTRLDIPRAVSRVQLGRLKRHGLGGVLLAAPSALCGSPVTMQGRSS